MKKVILLVCCCVIGRSFFAQSALVSNIYYQTINLYDGFRLYGSPHPAKSRFFGVRGGGIRFELFDDEMQRFKLIVNVVSNNYGAIASDWHTYQTNEMVRFTTLSAVGYSGYNNYTNFIDRFLTFCETAPVPGTNYWESIEFLSGPYGTPMESQLPLNYESPIVSNIIIRMRSYAIKRGDTESINFYNTVLSGEWKRQYLLMKAAGAL